LTGEKSDRRVEPLVSAGGVVWRRVDGHVQAALCGRSLRAKARVNDAQEEWDTSKSEDFRWSLAKGTPDPGETLEQTALREVREETGLEVEIESSLGAIEYWFVGREPGVRFHKTVHYYLMNPIGGGFDLHDPEFDVVQWFTSEKALDILAYANETEVLRRALKVIEDR
jgi:8-oxo-dGTP pyrophosphatase MutT (NUDIX family)